MKLKNVGLVFSFVFASCTTTSKNSPIVTKDTVVPGTSVIAGGKSVKLHETQTPLKVGDSIEPLLTDVDAATALSGRIAIVNVVPSVDTPVCEEQSHILGETKNLSPVVTRVSISRDLPMATKRFAKEASLENILYFSDYKSGAFGHKSGLMMQGNELLARAVLVVDTKGIIRYIQVVPDVTQLPDMETAFAVANKLAESTL